MYQGGEIMNMKKIKEKKGFTLAELLVVVAIVGILVAISIPVFTAQRMKAVIATNKANIRAAKAAATAEFYSNSDLLDVHNGNTLTTAAYFIYDVKEGKLSDVIKVNDKNYNGAQYNGKSCNTLGKELSNKAINGEVLDQITVFIGNAENENDKYHNNPSAIQTAPYYTDDNEIGYKGGNDNPFGPDHGSSTAG